jgi:hypothetical protein
MVMLICSGKATGSSRQPSWTLGVRGFPPGAQAFLTLGALAAVTLGAVTVGALRAVALGAVILGALGAAAAAIYAAGSDTLLQFLQFQI